MKVAWVKDGKINWKQRSSVQQGDTALIAMGKAAEYMHEAGKDKDGLA